VVLKGVTSDKKQAKDQDDHQERKGERNPFGHGETPPRLVEPMRRTRAFFSHRCEFHPESHHDARPSGPRPFFPVPIRSILIVALATGLAHVVHRHDHIPVLKLDVSRGSEFERNSPGTDLLNGKMNGA
jgi:hypothetical protein